MTPFRIIWRTRSLSPSAKRRWWGTWRPGRQEYTNLRILLMGRGAGLSAEVIRSRLRQSYV